MGQISIGERPVEDMTDGELTSWFEVVSDGYKFRAATLAVCLAIMRVFDDVGTPMTVRQMFYRLVSVGAVDKAEKSYRKVQYHLLNMRRHGVVPYTFIADNTRWMRKPNTWDSADEMLTASAASYRRALWTNQPHYVEVWVEKDALAGVIGEITRELDVALMVTRGFPSETFQYEAAQTIIANNRRSKVCNIFYFGDYDPSGLAISDSLERRLREFGADVIFHRVAVNPEQILTMNLDTRPTKKTDTRAKNFQGESVELDAIHPNILRQMVRESIESVLDRRELEAVKAAELYEKETLQKAVASGFLFE